MDKKGDLKLCWVGGEGLIDIMGLIGGSKTLSS